jgi:hypothetical protein
MPLETGVFNPPVRPEYDGGVGPEVYVPESVDSGAYVGHSRCRLLALFLIKSSPPLSAIIPFHIPYF